MGLTALDGVRRAAELAASVARTRLGLPDRPRLLTYVVTFRCNARCVMCDSWKKDGEGELDLEQIERVYRQLPQLHAVRLTGGEPFVRKDFAEIAALTERVLRPALLHVTTNGFLTDRIVSFCERRDRKVPLQLLVSIDGVGEKHNEVRGRNNAWDQAMATVRALAPRRKELGIELAVNQTIVDAEGARHYTRLRDILAPLDVRNQVVIAYDVSATYSLKREVEAGPPAAGSFTTFGDLGADVLGDLFAEIDRDLERYPLHLRVAKRYYLEGIRSRLLHHKGSPNPPCVALGAHLRMYPNGDVPTCQFNSRRVGNLATEGFADVWSGPAIERQRKWVRDCAGCWAECEVLPNALYSGDLLRAVRSARHPSPAAAPPAEAPSPGIVSIS
jgi:MoaA/NifB/PqqE/SkfB family radical SAM enzyme